MLRRWCPRSCSGERRVSKCALTHIEGSLFPVLLLSWANDFWILLLCGWRSFLVKEAAKNKIPSGQRVTGLMHIADWYATFCALAGVDATDASAASAGLFDIRCLGDDDLRLWGIGWFVLARATLILPRSVKFNDGVHCICMYHVSMNE